MYILDKSGTDVAECFRKVATGRKVTGALVNAERMENDRIPKRVYLGVYVGSLFSRLTMEEMD